MSTSSGSLAFNNQPAAKPPPGITPDFSHPHSNGYVLITVGTIFLAFMLVFVSLRFYTKIKVIAKLTPDDWTCLIATILTTFYYVIVVLEVTIGHYGTHIWELTIGDLQSNDFWITGYMSDWTISITLGFVKVTFFLFYLQLFRPMKRLRYSCYGGIAITTVFYVTYMVVTLAATTPSPGQSWAESEMNTRYIETFRWSIPSASVSLVLDICILVLPMAAISKLQLSRNRKFGLAAIFLTGFGACIASSLSIYYRRRLEIDTADVTYEVMPVNLCALVEMVIKPSLSKLLRNAPNLTAVWESLGSKFSLTFRSRSNRKSGKSSNSELSDIYKQHAPYSNIVAPLDNPYAIDLAPSDPTKTYIRGGQANVFHGDGIQIERQLEQEIINKRKDESFLPR
ncbi:MAG: hypothetical protein M1821_009937 [Bathelium mastoideum]|nr:MAG: hypothetical protein M1821_009937 [Bathelium mastoideum]